MMHALYRGLLASLVAIPWFAVQARAQAETTLSTYGPGVREFDVVADLLRPLILAVVFTIVGLALFVAAIWLIVRLTPFSIQKEIEEDQNIALGIIIGSIILGIAVILAAAMVG